MQVLQIMIGNQVTIQDIVLELEPYPIDLFCEEEELPTEQDIDAEEESQKIPYKVVAPCGCCDSRLRLYIFATNLGIRTFQSLLLEDINLLCPTCRQRIQYGGE